MTEARAADPVSRGLALLGLVLVAVLGPLVPGRFDVSSATLDAVILTVPLAIALAVPFLRREGAFALPRTGMEVPAFLFIVVAAVGAGFSFAPVSALLTLSRYAAYVVLVIVAGALCRAADTRRVVLWAVSIAATASAVLSLAQNQNPTANIGLRGLPEQVATRVFATFENPNFYAEYLVLAIGATIALALTEKGVLKWVVTVTLGLQGVALMLTYTRGSWVALAAGIMLAIMMVNARYVWLFFAAAAAGVMAVPGALERVVSIFSLEGTAGFRIRLWQVTLNVIGSAPVFGVGLGEFYTGFQEIVHQRPDLSVGFLRYGAHNSFLQIMAETGVVGGLAFAWMIVALCRTGFFVAARSHGDRTAMLQNAALTASLVGFTINALSSNAFQHPQGAVIFWLLAGVQAGIATTVWKKPERDSSPVRLPALRLLEGSVAARGLFAAAGWLQSLWRASSLRRTLISRPYGDGSLLRDSRVAGMLLGRGGAAGPEGRAA